jgi:enamine deaminase RidA (YjgF/YER057c/UK114 family)
MSCVAASGWMIRAISGPSTSIYQQYFGEHPPARACVQSSMMVDCKVEIDCVAYKAKDK